MPEGDNVDRLIGLSDDELLIHLGAALTGRSSEILRDGEEDSLRQRGLNWLERNRRQLRERICADRHDLALNQEGALEAAAVADLLADLLSQPAAFTVAIILLRRGIEEFCAE